MKLLKLRHCNKHALVDDEDYDRLDLFKWSDKGGVIQRSVSTPYKSYSLASEIMRRRGVQFDHADRDYLNNQKYNLRECSHGQNQMNKAKMINGKYSSKYKGVSWSKSQGMWRAVISINKKYIHIGYFSTEEAAAIAYNNKAVELFKESAFLNKISPDCTGELQIADTLLSNKT